MTRIPEIPVTPLLAGATKTNASDTPTRARILEAATGPGFMVLTGLDTALGLPADIHARLLRFFQMPPARRTALARRKFAPDHANVYRGVFPLQDGEATYKEGIDIGPDAAEPGRAGEMSGDPLQEPTPWPPESALPGWRADIAAYYGAMERLGRVIVGAIAEGLGVDDSALLPLFERGNSTLRLIHYPERPASSLPDDMTRVTVEGDSRFVVGAAHCDNGFVTLLWQDPTGGLQARAANGDWIDVPPAPGALAVNFGTLLSDWSGGRIRATEHRVLGGLQERCSIPFFFEPAVDARITPIAGGGESYVYGDKLWERMTAFVEFSGLERRRAG